MITLINNCLGKSIQYIFFLNNTDIITVDDDFQILIIYAHAKQDH